MKPENALPAYLYCKLVSTFQPGRKRHREDGTSRKSRRESGKTCSGQSSTKTSLAQNHFRAAGEADINRSADTYSSAV